ncbi:MAG: serine/threonine-protein kinase, partial [Calditrichota bacterium]
VYGFGEIEDSYYIAMEYVAGLTLDRVVRSGELSLQKVLDVAIQIADGLREAHHAGIIHRDIKAKNLILDNKGRIKILDFGTAKFIQAPEITMAGTTFGTLHYLSPEQVADLPVDHRSDIFSYGILLYEILTGNRPFQGEGQAAVLYAIMNSQPRPIMQFRQKVPAGIKKIIARLLEKEANSRYQTMEEVLLDLRREKTLLPITEPASNIDPDYTKPIQRDETMMCVNIVEPGGIPTIPGSGLSDTGPQAAIIRAIREHGGELIAEADGALYSRFNQSFNAVQSALEIQNSLNRFGLS